MAPAKQSPTITLLPAGAPVRIMFASEELVNTDDALVLREGSLPPVLYIPKADVRWELTTATDRSTHCPYKGDAQYWSVSANGKTAENAIWSYPDPIESVSAIGDCVALYWDKMDAWFLGDQQLTGPTF
jgi:uncharacterized protein (DUF427 family)